MIFDLKEEVDKTWIGPNSIIDKWSQEVRSMKNGYAAGGW